MVAQQRGHGAGAAEPGHFPRADAAFRPHDEQDFAWTFAMRRKAARLPGPARSGRTASSWRMTARPAAATATASPGRIDGGAYFRDPGPARLFGGSRDHRLPFRVRLRGALTLPAHDGPFGLPGYDRVDAQFRGCFRGQFVAVALGQCLDQHQPESGRASRPRASHSTSARPATTPSTVPVSRLPAPSTISTASPAASRLTVTACRASARQAQTGRPGRMRSSDPAAAEEDRIAHRYRLPSRSRSLAKMPPLAASFPSVNCSPRSFGQLPQQVLLGGVELGGRLNLEMDLQVAAAVAAQVRHAQAAQCDDLAGLGPGLTSISCSPSKVSSVSSVPRAAAVIGMLRVACRSSPSRT